MTYVKNTWVDQEGQIRYRETQDGDFKILTPNYEQVTEIGTPVNADNMNHIEDGIVDCYNHIDTEVANAKDYSLNLLKTIYPVGSIYISTSANCPLASLFGTWELVAADRVLQGSSGSHAAGTTIAAGLPNHRHWYTAGSYWGADPGARAAHWSHGNASTGSATGYFSYASEDNSIYGASSTVQPPAYVVNIWRRTA